MSFLPADELIVVYLNDSTNTMKDGVNSLEVVLDSEKGNVFNHKYVASELSKDVRSYIAIYLTLSDVKQDGSKIWNHYIKFTLLDDYGGGPGGPHFKLIEKPDGSVERIQTSWTTH